MSPAQSTPLWFSSILKQESLVERLKKIKFIVADVDGCLTDCTMLYANDGNASKAFSIQDGYAMTKLASCGLTLALLSGRSDTNQKQRATDLGIPEELCFFGIIENKNEFLASMQQKFHFSKEETLFIGDDFIDIKAKPQVGLFVAPANAVFYVQHASDFVLPLSGGHGAFRLLLDLILYVQEKHFAQSLIKSALDSVNE